MEIKLKNFENEYSVSACGKIFSYKGVKKELIGKIAKSGYREVILTRNRKKHYLLVHRLVAETFIENPDNLRTVNHKDGNKLNNHFENLEWNSDSQNLKHARNSGLLKTKITKEIADMIRKEKGSHRSIASKYGIGKTQVGYIKAGKRWN